MNMKTILPVTTIRAAKEAARIIMDEAEKDPGMPVSEKEFAVKCAMCGETWKDLPFDVLMDAYFRDPAGNILCRDCYREFINPNEPPAENFGLQED
jgi:hypothetical protein